MLSTACMAKATLLCNMHVFALQHSVLQPATCAYGMPLLADTPPGVLPLLMMLMSMLMLLPCLLPFMQPQLQIREVVLVEVQSALVKHEGITKAVAASMSEGLPVTVLHVTRQ